DADRFASHSEFMTSNDLCRHMTDREIPTIEIPEVIGVDAEPSGHAHPQLRRRRQRWVAFSADHLDARRGHCEWRGRVRSAALAIHAERRVEQQRRRTRVSVND